MAQKVRERARCYEPNRARFDDLNFFFFFFPAGGVRITVMLEGNVNTWIFMHAGLIRA